MAEYADTPELIRQVLVKRRMKVLNRTDDRVYVIYAKGNKIQYGYLSIPYTHRYGINVLCNYDGKGWWYQSRDMMSTISPHVIELGEEVWEDETRWDSLVDLDLKFLNTIEVSW